MAIVKKTKTPKISVVMGVFNGAEFIRETMDSILGQTFTDFEFIIINDGSTDDTAKIIRSYTDPRIRFVDNKKIQGMYSR
jgi:glycosyltransferase involved in cell wall biosynthesis